MGTEADGQEGTVKGSGEVRREEAGAVGTEADGQEGIVKDSGAEAMG